MEIKWNDRSCDCGRHTNIRCLSVDYRPWHMWLSLPSACYISFSFWHYQFAGPFGHLHTPVCWHTCSHSTHLSSLQDLDTRKQICWLVQSWHLNSVWRHDRHYTTTLTVKLICSSANKFTGLVFSFKMTERCKTQNCKWLLWLIESHRFTVYVIKCNFSQYDEKRYSKQFAL
jgi:hypothetical protein